MRRICTLIGLLMIVLASLPANAAISSGETQVVDFVSGVTTNTGEEATTTTLLLLGARAHRSADGVTIDEGDVASEGYVVCAPLAVGMKARPLTKYHMSGTLEMLSRHHRDVRIFARYSYDQKLWSQWSVVSEKIMTAPVDGSMSFECDLAISSDNVKLFHDTFWNEWAYKPGLGKFNGANMDEYCEYLQQNHPEVFKQEIPIIRYIQLRIECPDDIPPRMLLKKLNWGGTWTVGGIRQ